MNHFGNLYLHIDYDINGFHYNEKTLVSEDAENQTAEIHFVSGPYPNDLEAQHASWNSWFEQVKKLSE